jgi:MOSC domain-containing protein YiiM
MKDHLDSNHVQLLSVQIAEPSLLGRERGRLVESGFRKQTVATETVTIGWTNIAGDRQADLTVHGGPEKAVYAYSADRHADWRAAAPGWGELGPNYFGENLTVSGWLETDVRIGDVWTWGSARLEVCQPRWPCYKFALASGRPDLSRIMLHHGWTGWYLRVLTTGEAPVHGPIQVAERGPEGVTVFDAHAARLPHADPELIERVIAAPALASGWRASLEQLLFARRSHQAPSPESET